MNSGSGKIELLLVEDNPGDVMLTRKSLDKLGLNIELHVAGDGEEGLAFIKNGNDRLPNIILLDLNLPRMDGKTLLQEIKSDPSLRHIPVIILTSSHSHTDIQDCYKLGANAYIQKPVEINRLIAIYQSLISFWIDTVTLPKS